MEADIAYELSDPMLVSRAAEALRSRLCRRGLAICVSGIDGSGKTTLARNLVRDLQTSGVPARHLHLYQWYVNVLVTPFRLFYNRYFGCKLLVFDRTIYDNIAVAAVGRYSPRWLLRAALAVVLLLYPRFDYRFYLVVAFTETLLRRPDTDKERFMLLSKVYDNVALRARYIRLQSDVNLFSAVLHKIAVDV